MSNRKTLNMIGELFAMASVFANEAINNDPVTFSEFHDPKPYKYSGERDLEMTNEELEHIRSLSKKERKIYMKQRRKS